MKKRARAKAKPRRSSKKVGFGSWFKLIGLGAAVLVLLALVAPAFGKTNSGFDQYGYNYQARLFNAKADGVDRLLDGNVWGDPTYGNDRLVMKWSKAWDDARFRGEAWNCDAWEDNEWNGKVTGGSGETWHYKIVWVGPELEESSCWREGGQPIWGQFEVTFSQGNAGEGHIWETLTKPSGYGSWKGMAN
jgi:hypothetical protein